MNRGLRPSGIRAVFDRALELERAGRDIVHLEIGRPHPDSPAVAKDAAASALASGAVHYTANRGIPELREALAAEAARSGLTYDPEREIVVTAGGSEAVHAACFALLEPGDEVLIPTPAWPHYDGMVRLAGGVPVEVPCAAETGFRPDLDRVRAAIGSRTRLLVLASPANPTGTVLRDEDLEALAALCIEHDLWALSDEIYRRFTYGGREHRSIASLPGMRERTVIADSFSKTYSMTGWRVGHAAAPAEVADRINVIHQHLSVCAPAFAQWGAVAALLDGESFATALVAEYGERRDELLGALGGMDAARLDPPEGAFYAFPAFPGPGGGDALALRLLEEAGVAVVPGRVFGAGFEDHIRISYAVDAATLREGVTRLGAFLGP